MGFAVSGPGATDIGMTVGLAIAESKPFPSGGGPEPGAVSRVAHDAAIAIASRVSIQRAAALMTA
jgi:hypothetical protein